ncbi:hypothetical protein [Hippea alviniae]|uniref:hypothetical protein n=1 Tax=Hippea alviniae TaxID=1279027 RepID=UPI0003B74BD5|nr:hypothetical protein [Hippea alviniae]
MLKKSIFIASLLLFAFTYFSYAKEASEIEDMLKSAKNLNLIITHKSFDVCLNSKNAEALFKFRVKNDGDYRIYSTSDKVDFEGKLLSRNFNYELVVDCTDFNIKSQKRIFDCKEELRSSKTYYLYFTTTGDNPALGCINMGIDKVE